MSRLTWDQIGDRLYEAGLDHGVLYQSDGLGVAWNGLTNIDEDVSGDSAEARYFDGVKVQDTPSIGDFAAELSALTYPDEFLEYEGVEELGSGFFVDGQTSKTFGLAIRTLVGNDVDGLDRGYKIHILYNLTANPGSTMRETLRDAPTPLAFTWSLTSVPSLIEGYRPTAHVILDSRDLPADILAAIEDILYGKDGSGEPVYDAGAPTNDSLVVIDGGSPGSVGVELDLESGTTVDPRLPSIAELIDLVTLWSPKIIVPDSVTGLSDLINGSGDLTETNVSGVFTALPGGSLVPSAVEGFYVLS